MRLMMKITLNLVMYGVLGVVILIQAFPPVKWQQPLQLTKVARAAFVMPPKPAKLPKPKLLSRHDLTHILQQAGWPRKLRKKAIKVAFCESGLDPRAVGKKNSYDIGVLQVNTWIHREKIPGNTIAEKKKYLMDPYANALIALKVYRESERFRKPGWQPWSASAWCHHLVKAKAKT